MKHNYEKGGSVQISGEWYQIADVDLSPPDGDDMFVFIDYPSSAHRQWVPDCFIQDYRPPQKTVREWLETLPDGYRERALANMEMGDAKGKQAPSLAAKGKQAPSLAEALYLAFVWSESVEGMVFWHAVKNSANNPNKYNLPPLPEGEPEEWVTSEEWSNGPWRRPGTLRACMNGFLTEKYGPPPIVRVYNGEPPERFGLKNGSDILNFMASCWLQDKYYNLELGDRWMEQPPAPEQ